ncbi:MAG TPA: hypothetical protein DEF51_01325 [Myxococcales bacterium]|nr:hypothetical protein [Myxococcales bacterium]
MISGAMKWRATALSLLLAACGGAAPPPTAESARVWRHATRVEQTVIRTLSVERGVALDPGAVAEVRQQTVQEVAASVDALSVAQVESLRLDINLASLGPRGGGTRARCLITVSTVGPPERTRAILEGAATVHAHETPRIAAANGAIRAALRRLPQALAAL